MLRAKVPRARYFHRRFPLTPALSLGVRGKSVSALQMRWLIHSVRRLSTPRSLISAFWALAVLSLSLCCADAGSLTNASDRATLILVIGAPGEAEFGSNFVQQAA